MLAAWLKPLKKFANNPIVPSAEADSQSEKRTETPA
jgi:hypothetical protein